MVVWVGWLCFGCLGAAVVDADWCVLCVCMVCRVACVRVYSLGSNGIGKDGAVAIAGVLAKVPHLTTLRYLHLVLVLPFG